MRRAARGPLLRVLPQARRFLSARRQVLFRLGGWSLLESTHTFLGGYSVAQALDRGFLAGRTATGLGWLAVAAVAVVVGGLANRGVFRGLAGLVEPLRDGLLRRVVSSALREAVADPARAGDSAVVSRLTHQTEIARDSFAGLVLVARSFLFTAAGALLGLAALAPRLLLIVLPPLFLGLALFLATLVPMAARQQDYLRADEDLAEEYGAVATGLRDVIACGAEDGAAARAGARADAEVRAARALARWAAARTVSLGVAGQAPLLLLIVATPWLLREGVTAGELIGALTYLTQSLLPALQTLMTALGAAGTRLLVILDRLTGDGTTPPDTPDAPGGPDTPDAPGGPETPGAEPRPRHPGPRPPACPGPGDAPAVEFRSVTFAYGAGARPVLRDLDLTVTTGEHLTVVGPSGIGKSTLTGLVAGLLRPDRGEVRVHGRPVRPCPSPEAARPRALIPQQAYVFTGTLRENLRYLCPDDAVPEASVHASVRAVGLGELVRRLGGLDTVLDPAVLSQGERQLIALGRAYLSPASLVLLDEATCHLDPVAEERAERAFAERSGTLIVVAHRITSAHRADRVLVMDGTHATCGRHGELLDASPLYRDLVGHWHSRQL